MRLGKSDNGSNKRWLKKTSGEPLQTVVHKVEVCTRSKWSPSRSLSRFPWHEATSHVSQAFLTTRRHPFILLGVERHRGNQVFCGREHNTVTWPGLEPRPLNPESSAITLEPHSGPYSHRYLNLFTMATKTARLLTWFRLEFSSTGSSRANKTLLMRMMTRMKLSKCLKFTSQWHAFRTLQKRQTIYHDMYLLHCQR